MNLCEVRGEAISLFLLLSYSISSGVLGSPDLLL